MSRGVHLYQSVIQVMVHPECDLDKSKPKNVNIKHFRVVRLSDFFKTFSLSVSFMSCMYVQSLNNTAFSVSDFVETQGLDILALAGMWLGSDSDPFVISESVPSGHSLLHFSRKQGQTYGGIVIMCIFVFNVMMAKTKAVYTHSEHIDCSVSDGSMQRVTGAIHKADYI